MLIWLHLTAFAILIGAIASSIAALVWRGGFGAPSRRSTPWREMLAEDAALAAVVSLSLVLCQYIPPWVAIPFTVGFTIGLGAGEAVWRSIEEASEEEKF